MIKIFLRHPLAKWLKILVLILKGQLLGRSVLNECQSSFRHLSDANWRYTQILVLVFKFRLNKIDSLAASLMINVGLYLVGLQLINYTFCSVDTFTFMEWERAVYKRLWCGSIKNISDFSFCTFTSSFNQ